MNENIRASMENTIGEIKVSQKSDFSIKTYTRTDGLFGIACILLGFLFVRFFVFDFWYVMFDNSLVIYAVIYISSVVLYARTKNRTVKGEGYFWLAVLAVIVLMFKIENFFRLILAIAVAAYFTAITGGLYQKGTSEYLLADVYSTFITRPFVNFFSIVPALLTFFKRKDKNEKLTVSPVMWGVVLSVIALWFILPLLFAADSNFLKGIKELREYLIGVLLGGFDLFTIIIHTIIATPVACYIFGLVYGSMAAGQPGNIDKTVIDSDREKIRISPSVTLKVSLYIVCFVYLLFIMLQAEYLLGAFIGKLYSSMTYAEYARTGFFELCRVAAINLSLLAICNLLIIKNEEKAIKTPMVLLCVLSLLLLSTATAKMAMYISVYGLTVKRVISTVFLLWLIMVFAMCIVRLHKQYNLVKTAVITGTVMFCVLFSFDIGVHCDNYNAKHDFDKYVQPEMVAGEQIYLPDRIDVVDIHISYSGDDSYSYTLMNDMVTLSKLYNIMEKAQPSGIRSVQDFPEVDKYYTITICPDMFEVKDDVVIYCYEKHGQIYLEQPYNGIWITDSDLPYMFSNYRF